MSEKPMGVYKKAQLEAEKAANAKPVREEGIVYHEYPDYQTYHDVQVAGNKAKLRKQFVKQPHIELLSAYLNEQYGPVDFGICHGVRRGLEQRWFRKHLAGSPEVIGTEISDTATDFDNTVQWDFHDENPDWLNRADFVYSNSWDHAFDPVRAFRAWVKSLKPGGLMLLDHTKGQLPDAANALDPFGATYEKLLELLAENLGDLGEVVDEIDQMKSKVYRSRVVVLRKKRQ